MKPDYHKLEFNLRAMQAEHILGTEQTDTVPIGPRNINELNYRSHSLEHYVTGRQAK
ncbi:protein of unknown function [Candidatus Nitrotoga arctica]|uniref:Uncharacterized protein n=1 Tax=Candidatus Nitrotoga arctica TaxID=453162 RepID=A0ABM8YXA9_9PROT|nr:protein of unknown function [Candidatus Nitrotoga arctica]